MIVLKFISIFYKFVIFRVNNSNGKNTKLNNRYNIVVKLKTAHNHRKKPQAVVNKCFDNGLPEYPRLICEIYVTKIRKIRVIRGENIRGLYLKMSSYFSSFTFPNFSNAFMSIFFLLPDIMMTIGLSATFFL